MNIHDAKKLILETFITKSGKLNSTASKVKLLNSIRNELNESIQAESHINATTIMWCIVNDALPKRCLCCDKQLNVYRFISGYDSGKGSKFCSHACSSKYIPSSIGEDVYKDFSLLFDPDGRINSKKVKSSINDTTIEYLKVVTGINSNHVHTLLVANFFGSDTILKCKECGKTINVNRVTKEPYTKLKQFCSKQCRNKNTDFKQNIKENNLLRVKSYSYRETIGIPWFENKIKNILNKENISMLDSYDEVIATPRQTSYFNFKCNSCDYKFKARFIYTPICKKCNPNSKPQQSLIDYIDSFGYTTLVNDRTLIKPYELDIVIPELKVAIEYDGLYWHRNKNDYHKLEMCKKIGYRLIKIYDDEPIDIVKSRLAAIIGKTQTKIHARKCNIAKIEDNNIYKKFMEDNHIQGYSVASEKYGLEYNGELVSIMSFGKTRFSKTAEWELIRFANKLNTSVVGGSSKLFKRFITDCNPSSILSYCDLRWGTGGMYEKIGFKHLHNTKPGYFWYKGKRESRIKYQKHKLPKIFDNVDMSKSESEIMIGQGYSKIYDFGNLVYHWTK